MPGGQTWIPANLRGQGMLSCLSYMRQEKGVQLQGTETQMSGFLVTETDSF